MNENKLVIKNIPKSYPIEQLNSIFKGNGAIGIKYLTGFMKGTVFLDFSTSQEAQLALDNLNNFKLKNKQLKVELVRNPTTSSNNITNHHDNNNNNCVEKKEKIMSDIEYYSHFFPPNQYTLDNINHFLKTNSEFYSKVLFTMNQMNLQFSQQQQQPNNNNKRSLSDITNEKDNEVEEDDNKNNNNITSSNTIEIKRVKLNSLPIPNIVTSSTVETPMKFNIQMKSTNVELNNKVLELGLQLPIEDISLSTINSSKVTIEDIYKINKKPLDIGEVSNKLYLKNLDKSISKQNLYSLFKKYFNSDDELINSLEIVHFKEGKLRNQAFVTFPTTNLSEKALNDCQGYNLSPNKPLIIQYSKSNHNQS